MRLFDENFKKNRSRYILQSLLAGLSVGIALALFNVVEDPFIVAAFGASSFIAFGLPHSTMAKPRNLIGGYAVGSLIGGGLYFLTTIPLEHPGALQAEHLLTCAVAVVLAMIVMTVTNTEHAPATSVALGLVINGWTPGVIVKVMIGITIISIINVVFKDKLIDLI